MPITASSIRVNIIPPMLYALMFVFVGVSIARAPTFAFFLTGVICFVIFFFHTREAVFFYSAYLAFEETILQYVPETFFLFVKYSGDLMLLMLLFAVFTKLATRKYSLEAVKRNPVNLPLFIFIVLAVISSFVNEVPAFVALAGMRQLLRYIVLYYLVIIISSSEWDDKAVKNLLHVLMAVLVVQVLLGYTQGALGPGSKLNHLLAPGRHFYFEGVKIATGLTGANLKGAYGTLLSRNTYGIFIMSFALMLIGILQYERKRQWQYYFLLLLMIPCVFISYSRQSMFGLLLGAACIGIICRNKRLLLLIALAIILFALTVKQYKIITPAYVEKADLVQRIASPFQRPYLERSLATDRLFAIVNFSPRILGGKYFFVGLGPGAFGSAVGAALGYFEGYRKLGIFMFEHRFASFAGDVGFLALLGQFGVLGLLSLLWIIVWLFVALLRIFRRTDDAFEKGFVLGALGLIPGFLLTNVGYTNLELRQSSFYFWLVMALAFTRWGKETVARMSLPEGEKYPK